MLPLTRLMVFLKHSLELVTLNWVSVPKLWYLSTLLVFWVNVVNFFEIEKSLSNFIIRLLLSTKLHASDFFYMQVKLVVEHQKKLRIHHQLKRQCLAAVRKFWLFRETLNILPHITWTLLIDVKLCLIAYVWEDSGSDAFDTDRVRVGCSVIRWKMAISFSPFCIRCSRAMRQTTPHLLGSWFFLNFQSNQYAWTVVKLLRGEW